MTPIYIHDCDKCKFHGSLKFGEEIYDIYSCKKNNLGRVEWIYRYSNEKEDYGCLWIDKNLLDLLYSFNYEKEFQE